MSTGPNRIMDEFAKLMTDAAGAAQGVRKEVETAFHAQAERWMNSMDLIKREEFEAVREMAVKAREENDALSARIAELESRLMSDGKYSSDRVRPACAAVFRQGQMSPECCGFCVLWCSARSGPFRTFIQAPKPRGKRQDPRILGRLSTPSAIGKKPIGRVSYDSLLRSGGNNCPQACTAILNSGAGTLTPPLYTDFK